MPLSQATLQSLKDAGITPEENYPLARQTWWRVGGPADGFLEIPNIQQLIQVQKTCFQTQCPVFPLGNASNLLISDKGVRGLVLRLTGALRECEPSGDTPPVLRLGGGLKLVVLLKKLLANQWTGLESIAGVPGTVGGGVKMNAGTHLGEFGDQLIECSVVLPNGDLKKYTHGEMGFAYRKSDLPLGSIIAEARFQTTGEDPKESRQRIDSHMAHRQATQPTNVPTCGSTFRNPPEDYAGRLIEESGLKGFQQGPVGVSDVHGNFIVNHGDATAQEIRAFIQYVQDTVYERTGIQLEREIHYAGEW